jgi:hypothetical protein
MTASVLGVSRAAERTRSTDLCLSEGVSSPGSGAHQINRKDRPLEAAHPHLFVRTAERYWLLRFAGDELRFTHYTGAELWAAKLAAHGIASQLTRHDETSPASAEDERQIA